MPLDDGLGPCLIATYAFDSHGYVWRKRNGKHVGLHREAWEKHNNCKIPDGMEVMHLCDVTACIRGHHLRLGTHADNMAGMSAKGRSKGRAPTYGNARLSLEDVAIIKKMKGTKAEIARRYGVARTTISLIKNGKSWTGEKATYEVVGARLRRRRERGSNVGQSERQIR